MRQAHPWLHTTSCRRCSSRALTHIERTTPHSSRSSLVRCTSTFRTCKLKPPARLHLPTDSSESLESSPTGRRQACGCATPKVSSASTDNGGWCTNTSQFLPTWTRERRGWTWCPEFHPKGAFDVHTLA